MSVEVDWRDPSRPTPNFRHFCSRTPPARDSIATDDHHQLPWRLYADPQHNAPKQPRAQATWNILTATLRRQGAVMCQACSCGSTTTAASRISSLISPMPTRGRMQGNHLDGLPPCHRRMSLLGAIWRNNVGSASPPIKEYESAGSRTPSWGIKEVIPDDEQHV